MAIETPVRHPDYYFDDGNLVILVENTLFNVLRSTFTRHSCVFRDIFSLPQPVPSPDHVPEGSSDSAPLHIQGISCIDFERLLWILYPQTYGVHTPQTPDEWISILHLSTRWEFDDVRALAMREIERYPISPIKMIIVSQHFDICTAWTLKAYTELCDRREELTRQEESVLGHQTATRISQLRERLRMASKRPKILTLPGPVRGPIRRAPPLLDQDAVGAKKDGRMTRGEDATRRSQSVPASLRVFGGKSRKSVESSQLVAETFGMVEGSVSV